MTNLRQRAINHKFSFQIENEIKKFGVLDNHHALLALSCDWLIIIIVSVITNRLFFLYPICLLIIGSRQRGLSTILHDSTHGRAAKNKKLNFILGTFLSGYWLFLSFQSYKNSHVKKHHVYLGDKNYDPDFQLYIKSNLYDCSTQSNHFSIKNILSILFLINAPTYFYSIVKERMASAKLYPYEFSEIILSWLTLLFIAHHFNLLNWIILYWLLPYFTTYLIIGNFIEIAEHYPFLGSFNTIINLSRNRFSHWIEGIFLNIHNEGYHLVHHLRPNIPFWNMPKAHNIMMQDPEYHELNKKFGGIFLSSNNVKPLMLELLSPHSLK